MEVLLMYSGGLDSILSMARLVKSGYKVKLLHFDNGCSMSVGFETDRAESLQKQLGDNIEYIGKISTVASFRNNEILLANTPFSKINKKYGDCTISQIRCLNCRSAMYYEAIIYAVNNGIKYIAEGARKSQLFSIEQPKMIEKYRKLLKEFDIELLLPVYDLESDYERANELIRYGINPTASEDKCVLGMPLFDKIPDDQTDTICKIFESEIEPRYVKTLKNSSFKQTIYKDNIKFE